MPCVKFCCEELHSFAAFSFSLCSQREFSYLCQVEMDIFQKSWFFFIIINTFFQLCWQKKLDFYLHGSSDIFLLNVLVLWYLLTISCLAYNFKIYRDQIFSGFFCIESSSHLVFLWWGQDFKRKIINLMQICMYYIYETLTQWAWSYAGFAFWNWKLSTYRLYLWFSCHLISTEFCCSVLCAVTGQPVSLQAVSTESTLAWSFVVLMTRD